MAGSFRMALSRADVTMGDGSKIEQATVTVRDGVARARKNGAEVASMPAVELTRNNSRDWSITGPDGATWHVVRDCNCGGRSR